MATDTKTTRFPAPRLGYRTYERREAAERERTLRRDGESRADPNPARAVGIL
jgi:hypothetical protein